LSQKQQDDSVKTKERNTLLCIIAALCEEAKLDYTKPAKTAGLIQGAAQKMGVSIGETTIEGHLKKIPDALATRMK
jgi:phage tail sheath protein FI